MCYYIGLLGWACRLRSGNNDSFTPESLQTTASAVHPRFYSAPATFADDERLRLYRDSKLKQNANKGCNSCASLAGLVLCFIACFILLVIAP